MEIFHIIIGSIATIFFLIRFKYTKLVYQLLLAIWTPLTFLTYVTESKTFQLVLGIVQLVLFFLVMIFLFIARKKQMKKYMELQAMQDAENNVVEDEVTQSEEVTEEENI